VQDINASSAENFKPLKAPPNFLPRVAQNMPKVEKEERKSSTSPDKFE
jgi:hypothetical protein